MNSATSPSDARPPSPPASSCPDFRRVHAVRRQPPRGRITPRGITLNPAALEAIGNPVNVTIQAQGLDLIVTPDGSLTIELLRGGSGRFKTAGLPLKPVFIHGCYTLSTARHRTVRGVAFKGALVNDCCEVLTSPGRERYVKVRRNKEAQPAP